MKKIRRTRISVRRTEVLLFGQDAGAGRPEGSQPVCPLCRHPLSHALPGSASSAAPTTAENIVETPADSHECAHPRLALDDNHNRKEE